MIKGFVDILMITTLTYLFFLYLQQAVKRYTKNYANYDHMHILGNTLEEIAYQKAGIIKENSNTVFFEQSKEINNESGLNRPTISFGDTVTKESFSMEDILTSEEYGDRFNDILDSKIDNGYWQNVPDDLKDLEIYLNNKGITTIGITDVNSWLDMIQECK